MATSEEKSTNNTKEGNNLLGSPTFKELENGRFQCVETGHQLLAKDIESYSNSKRCRLGLIEFALSHKKPPLNMFKQDPLSRSKVVCKLTEDTINKTEEHIWKHINGKRFLNRLEEMEEGKLSLNEMEEELDGQKPEKVSKPSKDGAKKEKKDKKKKKKMKKEAAVMEEEDGDDDIITDTPKSHSEEGDLEEAEFWIPPPGARWDFDDGGDRWGSDSESESNDENKSDDVDEIAEDGDKESEEISMRTKRMSIEIGPSSFASRKKKSKKSPA
ncbi:uncharacterized protein LOC126798857 [Argentina anserina]|uniref:uncharacterized protein LOC126798857 n=1 Tax=Argentina anserina TaxID=57926 RepID=UPI002176280B|nr:uncharacterized protein LOC126798857 [Potentilla anserina]